MTLNGVIALILHYFNKFDSFAGRLRVVENRPIMSATYHLPKLTYAAVAWSLCNS